MENGNDKKSKHVAKAIKLNENDSICPNCNKIISIPTELLDDEYFQCPYCETVIFNPLLMTNCIVLCSNCNEPNHLSKHVVDELLVYCGICGAENLNPHSPSYNGMKCPICNTLFHIPNEIMNYNYIQCPFCSESVKNKLRNSNINSNTISQTVDTAEIKLKEINHNIFSNQYWIEYNKMYPNFKFILILVIIIFFGGLFSLLNNKDKKQVNQEIISKTNWYEGGTLHNATVNQWKEATYENKLATCADFVASIDKNISSEKELLAKAFQLQCCIDQSIKGAGDLNPSVAEISSLCLITLGYK